MSPPDAPFRTTLQMIVQSWDCDHVGHLNVRSYMGWMADAAFALAADLGLDQAAMATAGVGLAAVHVDIAFKSELKAGDAVRMETALLECAERKWRLHHRLRRLGDGQLALDGVLTAVCLDLATRRTTTFPKAFATQARALLVA